jgi:GntR family transcriptional repressor for pyruvate dehydrogenase complex
VLKRIAKNSLYEAAARQLQAAIEAGTWAPGARLPSERELAQMLDIGRSSVREALRVLETMDLVEIRPGEGTFVCQERHPLADTGLRALLQEDHIAQAYEVRELLDTQIAIMAVERATAEDLRAMESALDRMAVRVEAGQGGVDEDYDFHTALARVTDNEVLLQFHDMLWETLRPAIERSFSVPGRPARALAEHRDILRAIENRDPVAAREQILRHLHSRFTNPLASAALRSRRDTSSPGGAQ